MFLRRKAIAAASDEALVRALRDGHQASLGDLWDRYAHLLFGVCMKYLKDTEQSKDQVVELFTALPELLRKHEVERFRPWVHTVMRNRCLMALRSGRNGQHVPDDLLHDVEQDDAAEALSHESTLQQLERAIEQLNDRQRTCIRLFYLERQSYQQVAERTSQPLDQVRSHLQNGRRNLRLILQRSAQDGATSHADQNA
ncbi:MAG TPA: sigma-70 family RNA polymerase sigma factor [Flavobacteriales bacterium]|nr:sigma-70 family RNA polymerase sigma factor [Flavobacteriales bacterium]